MSDEKWLYEISPKNNFFSLNLKEVWRYRDLLFLFVKRDVITQYKQTILGPLWYLIQPLFTSIIVTLVFNNVAGIQTGKVPSFLYNLAGITLWNYFSNCLNATSNTFRANQHIFGKVYFPRLIMPLSVVISNLLKFFIQFIIFSVFYVYFLTKGFEIMPSKYVLLFPVLVILMGLIGLGLGMIISSLVTKYRDLSYLVGFGVQLLMYISLVVIPYSLFQQKGLEWVVVYNPLAYIIETARYLLLNEGTVSSFGIVYTICTVFFIVLFGILIFNKTEKNFIDTI